MRYLSKTIEYGLYFLAFVLPLQTRWIIKAGFTEYQTYSLYGTDILLILLLVLFVAYKFSIRRQAENFQTNLDSGSPYRGTGQAMAGMTNKKIARKDKLVWFLVGLVMVSAVSVFFASDRFLALYKLGWLVLGMGLFWLVSQADFIRPKLTWSLLAGIGLQSVLATWQFLAQATFANKWLGMALHRASDLGTSVIETVGANGVGERWLRAYGGLDHPNILGGVIAIGVLLLAGEMVKAEKLKNFQFSIFNVKIFKIISWILLVLFFAAWFFSLSRAAWLGLGAGLVAWLVGAAAKKDFGAQKNLLQIILILSAVGFVLFLRFPNLVMTRLYAGDRLEIKSTDERIESIKNSWPIIKSHWLMGVGLGNYTLALERELPKQPAYFYQPAHNAYVLMLSEIGIFGLLFFVGFIIYLFVRLLRRPPAGGFLAMTVALVVLLSFDHWLWSLHFGVLFFWLILGLIYEKNNQIQISR